MTAKLLIALHGNSGSGKSSVCKYLNEKHGLTIASTGAIVRRLAIEIFGNEDREILNYISVKIREIDKCAWIGAALRNTTSERIAFDSVRYLSDVDELRKRGFSLWTVTCPPAVAIDRLRRRNQAFKYEDLQHQSERELTGFTFDVEIDNGLRTWEEVTEDIDRCVLTLSSSAT